MQVLRLAVKTHQNNLMNHITAMFLIYKRLPLRPMRLKTQVLRRAVEAHQKELAA